MIMRPFGLAERACQPALQPQRGKLRDEFHHQHRIGEAAQRFGTIDAPGDEQEGQPRREPQQEAEDIGPAALGQGGDIILIALRDGGGR